MKKNWDKLKLLLGKECNPFMQELAKCERGLFLTRYVDKRNYKYDDGFDHSYVLNYRKTRGMNPRIHKYINEYFFDQFQWKIRNGCFCYSRNLLQEPEPISLFDKNFIVFPTDSEIQFVFENNIKDLAVELQDLNKQYFELDATVTNHSLQLEPDYIQLDKELLKRIVALNYSNRNFNSALQSAGEISLKTNFYYLVHKRYKDDLIDLIWG